MRMLRHSLCSSLSKVLQRNLLRFILFRRAILLRMRVEEDWITISIKYHFLLFKIKRICIQRIFCMAVIMAIVH